MEEWKDVKGYEGYYQVSNLGRVKSLERRSACGRYIIKKKFLKVRVINKKYKGIGLYKEGKLKLITIHRLIALNFIQNPENKPCVNHINGNKFDNNVSNLEWVTHSENTIHAYNSGFFGNIQIFVKLEHKKNSEITFHRSKNQASEYMGYNKCYLAKRTQEKRPNENQKWRWEYIDEKTYKKITNNQTSCI